MPKQRYCAWCKDPLGTETKTCSWCGAVFCAERDDICLEAHLHLATYVPAECKKGK